MLANILRTDAHAHRPLPADTELAQAIAVLARAQQDAVWARTAAHNKLRSHLREYYPAFLAAYAAARDGISGPSPGKLVMIPASGCWLKDSVAACSRSPAAAQAASSWRSRARAWRPMACSTSGGWCICGARKVSRSRAASVSMPRWRPALRSRVRSWAVVSRAAAAGVGAAARMARASGRVTGARVLAETGDDRSRFADAKGLKAYAGAAPITRASGKTTAVLHRRVKNQRLAATGYVWAFAALTASPGARAHYDRRRQNGDRHAAAQRNLFGRLLGCLHQCLATRSHYDETTAFPNATGKLPRAA